MKVDCLSLPHHRLSSVSSFSFPLACCAFNATLGIFLRSKQNSTDSTVITRCVFITDITVMIRKCTNESVMALMESTAES